MNRRSFIQTAVIGGVGCATLKPKKVLKRIASTEYLGARPCATEILGWSKMQRRGGVMQYYPTMRAVTPSEIKRFEELLYA